MSDPKSLHRQSGTVSRVRRAFAEACPECQATLIYSLRLDQWDCPTHGTMWSGPGLAISRGYAAPIPAYDREIDP